jgi:hypothetical protein
MGRSPKLDDAIVSEAGEQRLDIPRHEQGFDMGDESARLLDRARILAGHRNPPVLSSLREAQRRSNLGRG